MLKEIGTRQFVKDLHLQLENKLHFLRPTFVREPKLPNGGASCMAAPVTSRLSNCWSDTRENMSTECLQEGGGGFLSVPVSCSQTHQRTNRPNNRLTNRPTNQPTERATKKRNAAEQQSQFLSEWYSWNKIAGICPSETFLFCSPNLCNCDKTTIEVAAERIVSRVMNATCSINLRAIRLSRSPGVACPIDLCSKWHVSMGHGPVDPCPIDTCHLGTVVDPCPIDTCQSGTLHRGSWRDVSLAD